MSLRDTLRIMVVDDTAVSRGLLVQALEGLGVRHVDTARDGREALEALRARPVHMVVSDQHMPQMNGMELLRALRGNPATARTAFILVTGKPDRAVLAEGQSLGMNNFLAKPFTPVELRACIEAVVGPV